MNQEPKSLLSPTSDMNNSQPRRLKVEKLEGRSVLAAMIGMPDNLEVEPRTESSIASFGEHRQDNYQIVGPTSGHFGTNVNRIEVVQSTPGEAVRPISIQIADFTKLDLRQIDFRSTDNMPLIRAPWLTRLQDINLDSDQTHTEPGWGTIDGPPDSVSDNGPGDAVSSDPIGQPLDSAPESTPPDQPAPDTSKSSDDRRLPWLDLHDSPSVITTALRHSSHHSEVSRHEGRATSTAGLNGVESDSDEMGLSDDRQPTNGDSATELLELPIARTQATNISAHQDRHSAIVNASRRLNIADRPGPSPSVLHSPDISEVTFAPEFVSEFDEGGLVELVTARTVQSAAIARTTTDFQPTRRVIDAEVGLFQAIEVAVDPSHAAIFPVVLIAAFQLFDQRRKLEESDFQSTQTIGSRFDVP
ncbi:hypothetical protein [Anatilimnocola floriformis]|uniref:hypothetical protein n=1 Tax=Anatilimnocola floriformis TaxID=2948575 RepID=UPI0020C2A530|nr:hypothetical protein [Anatilimnocola floriformis]